MFGIRRTKEAMTEIERTNRQIEAARRNGPVHPPLSAEALAALAASLPRSYGRETGRLATTHA
jgi:hypothetical protein